MFKTREDVIALLKTYPQLKKKINLLEYERQHPAQVSSQEVISGLALAHPISEGPGAAGHISNKTMQIALNFQEETDRLNYATVMEIDQELAILRSRIEKLEFYVAQLDKRQAEVIRKYYFEEKTWPELQKEMHASSRTLVKRRDDGLPWLGQAERTLRLRPDVYSFLLSQRSKTRFELLPVILLEDFPRQTHPEVIARYDTPF